MRKTMTAAVMLLSGSILSGASIRGGMVGMPDGSDALRKVADAYAAAMRAGDPAAAAAVFASDATDMPPGSAPVRGRAAIEAYYRGLFAACRFTTFDLAHGESRISGDVGYLVGTSRAAVVPASEAGAAPREETGKYVVVFKRTADGWKAAYAIHNEDGTPSGR
ncbi:MAG TPA: SgcJ/EcaC family oxidoreductase [Thermoanaerobaculia bacterium]|nr:SgcJ/EcaC family oxidoreductase [Thermoanaerobaculia bacterium]